ncbi:MAG: hypothetical protein LBL84_01960 [Candidatus Nomurabacteria bacterium]|nr:hypothetical protein [Candidatus Nomurabacteria bacterium]
MAAKINGSHIVILRSHDDERILRRCMANFVDIKRLAIIVIPKKAEKNRWAAINKNANYTPVYGSKVQFVMISIRPEETQRCITTNEQKSDFIKEWVIITNKENVKSMLSIQSDAKLVVIDEATVVDKKYYNRFAELDHLQRNWLLRTSVAQSPIIDDSFIFIDDDHLPLVDVPRSYYVDSRGRYILRHMGELEYWKHYKTPFDIGERNAAKWLRECGYEELMYAIHAPQIIDKAIFKEAITKTGYQFGDSYGEWEIYCNYATSNYPMIVRKDIYETLYWPHRTRVVASDYLPKRFTYENHYEYNATPMDAVGPMLSGQMQTAADIIMGRYENAVKKNGEALIGRRQSIRYQIKYQRRAVVESTVFASLHIRMTSPHDHEDIRIYVDDEVITMPIPKSELADFVVDVPLACPVYGKNVHSVGIVSGNESKTELCKVSVTGV